MKNLLETKSVQVLENLTGIALGNGFILPEGVNRKEWAETQFSPDLDQDEYMSNFIQSLLEIEKIRNYFIIQLKKTLNPQQYGIERGWRQTQYEAIQAIITALENWFTRPLLEIPTGAGKSMVWGAVIRAFYDTLRVFGVEDKFEIILFTSRINIADQMIGYSILESEEDEDEPLIYGDVKMWIPMLADNEIRILAGRSGVVKEVEKTPKITLACYQGLTPKTVDAFFRKKPGLVIADESHRVTDRVRIIFENKMHSAFFVGGSATTKGRKENNPFIFFEAMKPEIENDMLVPYRERLAYHASILECIQRGELKSIRYINARAHIDLSDVLSNTRELPVKETAKVVAKNIPAMKTIIEELFLTDNPVLNISESKKVIDRKWLIFVDRVKIAEELAIFCNTELNRRLAKKFGKHIRLVADYVSGEMGTIEFNKRMHLYHNNETNIMFTSEKLGEGADVPEINGILSFRPYSASALWKTIQEIGRGTRFIPGEDLLVVDGVFKSENHEIGSLLSIFGVNIYLNGGLVAGYGGQRETEMKVFTLLKEGLTWKKVWSSLTEKERKLVPFIGMYIGERKSYGLDQTDLNEEFYVEEIEFVENKTIDSHELLKEKGNLLEIAREQLKLNEINDYWDLVYKVGPGKFKRINFGIFSSAIYFCRYLGVSLSVRPRTGPTSTPGYYLTFTTLDNLAEKLGWLPTEEQRLAKYKAELTKHGMIDYWTLIYSFPASMGSAATKLEWGVFGKTIAFISTILGENVKLSLGSLTKVAEKLGWLPTEEQRLAKYKAELAKHGIVDYWTLMKEGAEAFSNLGEFGIFGKATSFITTVVGKKIPFNNSALDSLAEKLGWLPTEEQRLAKYKAELAKHGIVDYWTLKYFSPQIFKKLTFDCIGKKQSFISVILGGTVCENGSASKGVFTEMANKLFPLTKAEKLAKYKAELAKHGMIDYWTVRYKKTIVEWDTLDFGIFGKIRSFSAEVLEKLSVQFSVDVIEILADKLFPITPDEKLAKYKAELAKHGIVDYWTLMKGTYGNFIELGFDMLGTGRIFFNRVTGLVFKDSSSLLELALTLGWSLTEEEKINFYKAKLAEHGMIDYWHFLMYTSNQFTTLDFTPFGKGHGFCSVILQRTIRDINESIKVEIAHALGWNFSEDDKIERCREELRKLGINNRKQFDSVRTDVFLKELDFGVFGKATSFIGVVLGEKLNLRKTKFTRALLNRVADKLQLK